MENKQKSKTDYLYEGICAVLFAAFFLGLLVGNVGVFARMLGVSISWTDEVLRSLFVWVYFVCGGITAKYGFLSISILEEKLCNAGRLAGYKTVKAIHSLGSFTFAACCTVWGYQIMTGQFQMNVKSAILGYPQGFTTLGLVLGFACWSLYEGINTVKYLRLKELP